MVPSGATRLMAFASEMPPTDSNYVRASLYALLSFMHIRVGLANQLRVSHCDASDRARGLPVC